MDDSVALLVQGEAGAGLELLCAHGAYERGFLLERQRLIALTAGLIMLDSMQLSGPAALTDTDFRAWIEARVEQAIAIHLSEDEQAEFNGQIATLPLTERFEKVEAQLGLPLHLLLKATNLLNRQEDFARLAMHRIVIEDVPEPQFINRTGSDPHLTRKALRRVLVALCKLSGDLEETQP